MVRLPTTLVKVIEVSNELLDRPSDVVNRRPRKSHWPPTHSAVLFHHHSPHTFTTPH
jgi:hypothetical protein